jgi:hypothetical protein
MNAVGGKIGKFRREDMRKYIFVLFMGILLAGCGYRIVPVDVVGDDDTYSPMQPGMGPGGMTWGSGSFDSVGEQIYFTGIDGEGNQIRYQGGPETGMMMRGYLACASCHGPDAKGGEHVMHMQIMDAPDIRWESLATEETEHTDDESDHHDMYDLETFRRAVVDGEHPDGEPLSNDMPRWQMSEENLENVAEYLMSLP